MAKIITMVGYFAATRSPEGDAVDFGGQTAKCRSLKYALESHYRGVCLNFIDTYKWKRNPFKLLFSCLKAAKNSDVVLVALSENGAKMLLPLFCRLRSKKQFKLGYIVIGSWVTQLVAKDGKFKKTLESMDAVFAETPGMVDGLEGVGFRNIKYVPNFKDLPIEDVSSRPETVLPLRLCTLSRVRMEKGITHAANVARRLNKEFGRQVITIDVYGPVHDPYKREFDSLLKRDSGLRYCGTVGSNETVGVIRKYDALLFPTLYQEGFPGTVVDAYAAGLPLIASKWDYADRLIEDGLTGLLYDFGSEEALHDVLNEVVLKPSLLDAMRTNCVLEAEKYMPESAMAPVFCFID